MAEDMITRAAIAIAAVDGFETKRVALANYSRHARAALLAAFDPEDEALQQLWVDVIDRFSDPASQHCMATFFNELKARMITAQGEQQ